MIFTKEQLIDLGIHELRVIGREVGVKSPSSLTKDVLVREIYQISNKQKLPNMKHTRGRPAKVGTGLIFDRTRLSKDEGFLNPEFVELGSSTIDESELYETVETIGYIDILSSGHGAIREQFIPNVEQDAIITDALITKHELKSGMRVKAICKKFKNRNLSVATEILENYSKESRVDFSTLKKAPANKRLVFVDDLKLYNKIAVVGAGESALISAPSQDLADRLILKLFNGLNAKNKCMVYFNPSLVMEEGFSKKKDEKTILVPKTATTRVQLKMLELIVQHKKRMVEAGEDVVLFVNNLNIVLDLISDINTVNANVSAEQLQILKEFVFSSGDYGKGSFTLVLGAGVENLREQVVYNYLKTVADVNIVVSEANSFLVGDVAIDLFKTNLDRNNALIGEAEAKRLKKLIYDTRDDYLKLLEEIK